MASALDIYFETRTLLEAVNDPTFETEPRFLIDNFWGGIKNVYSEYVDWEVRNGKITLARFRGKGASANVVTRQDRDVKTLKLPNIREKMPITAPELFKTSVGFSNNLNPTGANIDARRAEALNEDLQTLRQRIEEREEWMAAQLLTSPGVISYEDEEVAWTVNMGVPSELKLTLTSGNEWGHATGSNVVNDLETMSNLIRKYSGVGGTDIILGSALATAFRNDPSVRNDLETINFEVGRIRVDFSSNSIGRLANINFWTYRREYTDENGVTQQMWPEDIGVMIGANFKRNSQRVFGLVEEVEETFAGEFFSKSWVENDPSVRWILVASRPLPIAKQIGSWAVIDGLAA